MSELFKVKISSELAEKLYELRDGESREGWRRITEQSAGASRWQEHRTIVLKDSEGCFWGLPYEHGLTEMQENEYPWEGSPEVELDRLIPRERTITEFVLEEATYSGYIFGALETHLLAAEARASVRLDGETHVI